MPGQQIPDVHPRLAEVFSAMDAASIPWALLRSDDQLGWPDGDVDLLVPQEVEPMVADCLCSCGFWRARMGGRGSHRFYFAHEPRGWLMLDVVSQVSFGPWLEFPTHPRMAGDLLTRRHRKGQMWVLCGSDAFWHLLLHCLLDKGRLPDKHLGPLGRLSERANGDSPLAVELDRRLGSRGLGSGPGSPALLAAVRAADWATVERLLPEVRRRWRSSDPLRVPARTGWGRVARRLTVGPGTKGGPGAVVGLTGNDLDRVDRLAAALRSSMPLPNVFVRLPTPDRLGAAAAPSSSRRMLSDLRLARDLGLIRVQRRRGRLVFVAGLPARSAAGKRTGGTRTRVLRSLAPGCDVVVAPPESDAVIEVMEQRVTAAVWSHLLGRRPAAGDLAS